MHECGFCWEKMKRGKPLVTIETKPTDLAPIHFPDSSAALGKEALSVARRDLFRAAKATSSHTNDTEVGCGKSNSPVNRANKDEAMEIPAER
jgi:hypothetical protein